MKSNVKRLVAVAAAACLAASSLVGCGSNSNAASEPAASETEAIESTSEETAGEESASEGAVSDDTVYRIGICQLVQHDALDRATQGFEDALIGLLGEDHVDFDLQNAQGDSQMCATIANQFVSNDVDLIMANATASLQACANATNTIPVVGTSVTSFASALDIELDENSATGINVTGTNDLAPLNEQAQMIVDLFPDVAHLGILYCSAEVNSVYQAEHIAEYLDELGVEYENFSFADSNDLQSVVTNAVSKCDVIYIPTDNTAAANTNLIDSVTRPAGVPVIAAEEGICTGCGLASLSIDFYEIGFRAGEQAYDILVNGADPSTMTVEDPQTLTRVYNAEIAEELGITLGDEYVPVETN